MVIVKGAPAVCGLEMVSNAKRCTLPGLTAKVFDVPARSSDVTVILFEPSDLVTCTEPFQTPLMNEVVVIGVIVPVISDREAVLVNEATVLLNLSFAVIIIPNETPAVCVPIGSSWNEANTLCVIENVDDVPESMRVPFCNWVSIVTE